MYASNTLNFRCLSLGARVAQWWEYSPPINVALVWIMALMPYVGWVCCWFSPLLQEETNTSKFQFNLECMDTFYNNEFLKTSKCSVGKQITFLFLHCTGNRLTFFFSILLSNCLNWKIYCDDHSSLSDWLLLIIYIVTLTRAVFNLF